MERRADYTIVGIFIVTLTIAFVTFFFWLSANKSDKNYKTYIIYTAENVTGLSTQGTVRFNGVPVGFVESIGLDKTNPQLVKIRLQIQQGTPINTATYAMFNNQGITGLMYVGLKTTSNTAPLLRAQAGQPYPVIVVRRSLFSQLSTVVPTITKTISDVGKSIQLLLNKKNRTLIQQTLQNSNDITQTLAKSSHDLSESLAHLHQIMNNTAKASRSFPAIMKSLQATLKTVKSTAANLSKSSRAIGRTAKSGELVLNNANVQTLPGVQQTLTRLNQLTTSLDHLSRQLNRNPSMLIRGKAQPELGPGER